MTKRNVQPEQVSEAQSASEPRPSAKRPLMTRSGIVIRPKANVECNDAAGQQTKKSVYTIIRTDLLIPGDGAPTSHGALVMEGKLIAWVGPRDTIPKKYIDGPHRAISTPYLMPGLWDCHVHFGGMGEAEESMNYAAFISLHPGAAGARLAKGCWEALQRGYTSLRDVAGYGCEVAQAIDDGTIVGPNVYSSGACLSQTAGHGDIFELPAGDALLNLGVSHVNPGHFGAGMAMLVDGVDECRKAVRLQIRRGAKCIKVMASGGVMSRDDNPLYAQFSKEELECIVQEAGRQGRVVAAHVHGKPGILAATRAGVRTLEHVSFADEECIELIKEKDVIYIATRFILAAILATGGEGLPKHVWEKTKLVATHHGAAYKMAVKAGVTIALGTDTPPGANMAEELEHAVKAGLSTLEAIKAATANGPLTVGPQAAKSGQLKVGYEADVLGLTKNPVEDVKVLQDHRNIEWVWKGGKLFKGPGVGPWGEDYELT